MKNASLINPTTKMLSWIALSLACSYAQANGTEGYLSTSTAAGSSEVGPTAVYAAQDSVVARETARRRAEEQQAMQLLQEGYTAYQAKKYSEALEKFQQAWDRIPHAPATRRAQEHIRMCINDASVATAMQYSKVGRYDDAEQLLIGVIERDPNNRYARKQLALLRDPVRNNPALSPAHVKDVDEVNRLLSLAWGYYELGRYDQANIEFGNVLKIDPYNIAARNGQEAVDKRRSQYYKAAHDSYRARALAEVDSLWEVANPTGPSELVMDTVTGEKPDQQLDDRKAEILKSLEDTVISQASFDNTPISDVASFIANQLATKGIRMNVNFVKPTQTAAPIVAAASSSDDDDDDEDEDGDDEEEKPAKPAAPVAAAPYVEPTVSKLDLYDVSLKQVLDEACRLSGCKPNISDTGVTIYQKDDPNAIELVTRYWPQVPWDYFAGDGEEEDDSSGEDDPFGDSSSKRSKSKYDPKKALLEYGVQFPKGSYATYSKKAQRLTVVNTPENLARVDEFIDDMRTSMQKPMVKVTTKFVEVNQTNEEELSYDWVVNPFAMNNAGTIFAGGVNGESSNPIRTMADFVEKGGSGYTNYHRNNGTWPITNRGVAFADDNEAIRDGLMTGSLRSGEGALQASPMDTLLKVGRPIDSSTTSPAPGIMSVSGIYNEGSLQMIMRGLSQKKGVDIMTAPSLVITPGEEDGTVEVEVPPDENYPSTYIDGSGAARIEIVRRFVYPIAFDYPDRDNDNDFRFNGDTIIIPAEYPAYPTEFGAEEVGVVMVLKADDLKLGNTVIPFKTFIVRIVEFEGFINYGSPICAAIATQGVVERVTLTDNRMDQPIFSRRMVNTRLSLFDGHTVTIGGLIEDKVQKVEDKVPVFGDLPFIGRFFRSNAESHIRKNLTIFVTAEVVDSQGRRLHGQDQGMQPGADATLTPSLFPDDGLNP